jgi:hypothetical protein
MSEGKYLYSESFITPEQQAMIDFLVIMGAQHQISGSGEYTDKA